MTETILTNANLVLDEEVMPGTLVIRDGRIAEITSGTSTAPGAQDLGGDLLIPGLVELHTDHLERHFKPRPGVFWPPETAVMAHDAQLASAGVTTVFDALRAGSEPGDEKLGHHMRTLALAIGNTQAKDALRAEHFIHLRCELSSDDVVDQVQPFIEEGSLRLASLMDHTPGQRQFANLEKFYEYYQGQTGMSDADMQDFIDSRLERHHRVSGPNRRRIVQLCRSHAVALASHDDATPEHVEEAVEDGVAIAEFPTTMAAASASRAAGMAVLMGAPNVVRGGSHSGNVAAADLAREGLLDALSSDYVPFSLLQAVFRLDHDIETISLARAVRMVSAAPAHAVGLDDRGRIAPGLRADLVQIHRAGELPVVRQVWREGRRVV